MVPAWQELGSRKGGAYTGLVGKEGLREHSALL